MEHREKTVNLVSKGYPQWHSSFNKATAPKPSQTMLITGEQVLRCARLWKIIFLIESSTVTPPCLCVTHFSSCWFFPAHVYPQQLSSTEPGPQLPSTGTSTGKSRNIRLCLESDCHQSSEDSPHRTNPWFGGQNRGSILHCVDLSFLSWIGQPFLCNMWENGLRDTKGELGVHRDTVPRQINLTGTLNRTKLPT